jgi:hypothetical protein
MFRLNGGTALVAAQQEDDPILAHITKEAARIARAFQGQPRADDYRALAINNRLFATYVRSRKLDDVIKREMTRLVRQRGRNEVIQRATSPEMADHFKHTLARFGVHLHDEPGNIPQEIFEGQLDVMLQKGGLADRLETTATDLDTMYMRMEKIMVSNGATVLRTQTLEEQLRCQYLVRQCNEWTGYASVLCIGSYWGLLIFPCAGAGTAMAGYCGAATYYSCY